MFLTAVLLATDLTNVVPHICPPQRLRSRKNLYRFCCVTSSPYLLQNVFDGLFAGHRLEERLPQIGSPQHVLQRLHERLLPPLLLRDVQHAQADVEQNQTPHHFGLVNGRLQPSQTCKNAARLRS